MAELAGTFHRPFAEQVAAWQLRLGTLLPTQRWDDVWKDSHDRAFMVAGAMKADLLADLAGAVGKAIEEGASIQAFRADFDRIVAKRGWHGWTGEGTKAGEAWRTRVIYTTNMRSTYAAGRWAQLVAGGFKFLVYRHSGATEPREQHLAWDGLILPVDHPFWATHFPPNGWGCGCYVIGARSIKDAIRKGGNPMVELAEGWDAIDPRTGEPDGIDRGWGYAPGRTVADQVREMVAAKVATLPPQLATDLATATETPPAPRAPEIRKARSLKDAADLVVEAGIAEKRVNWPGKVQLDVVNDVIRTLWELKHRFDMVQLQVVGSSRAIGKATRARGLPGGANAWYWHQARAMGWNPDGMLTVPWHQKGKWTKLTPEMQDLNRALIITRRAEDHRKAIARLPDGPAKSAAQATNWDWTVVSEGARKPAATAIHETGHQLHFTHWDEINDAIRGWDREGWHLAVSEYGSSNFKEFVAESFVLYNLGPEHHHRIKPELLAVFKAKDRWNV
ncbi:phage minor head protein [Sagittula sp. S175]|uniref:phage head morphogenesis protein n=1 Tax=Sagittula sp. S175 TaxID=3415129 RepID=UPI003C7ED255